MLYFIEEIVLTNTSHSLLLKCANYICSTFENIKITSVKRTLIHLSCFHRIDFLNCLEMAAVD